MGKKFSEFLGEAALKCNECGHKFQKSKLGHEAKCPKCKGFDTELDYKEMRRLAQKPEDHPDWGDTQYNESVDPTDDSAVNENIWHDEDNMPPAWHGGHNAYWDKGSHKDNPHEQGTKEHKQWRKGFEYGKMLDLRRHDLGEATAAIRGRRVVSTHEHRGRKAVVYKNQDTGEHEVEFHKNGEHLKGATYFTDDKEDAQGTAKHWTNSSQQVTAEALVPGEQEQRDRIQKQKREARDKAKHFAEYAHHHTKSFEPDADTHHHSYMAGYHYGAVDAKYGTDVANAMATHADEQHNAHNHDEDVDDPHEARRSRMQSRAAAARLRQKHGVDEDHYQNHKEEIGTYR